MNGNSITVVGNLTRDPELKFMTNGNAMVRLTVADNFFWRKQGEDTTKTSFIDCIAWGSIAENISETFGKGDRVIVVGRLDQQSWETEDGDKRYKMEIDIDAIGPDLRWATAQINKVDSDAKPKRDSGGGSKRGTKRAPEPTYEDDEEPF